VESWRDNPELGAETALAVAVAGARLPGLGLLVWLLVLQRLEVGIAYPMLSLNFVLITLVARFVFHETIDRRHWLGVALVIGGVVLLGQHVNPRPECLRPGQRAAGQRRPVGHALEHDAPAAPEQWLSAHIDLARLAWCRRSSPMPSMLCWLAALVTCPWAGPTLLSISYALVYLLAASLPLFNEDFSFQKPWAWPWSSGCLTINSRPASAPEPGVPHENQCIW
jgi:undecaprenyl phosphate-alpha-L-ara4N flippase subunit ArnE